jgi:hypothetical protein
MYLCPLLDGGLQIHEVDAPFTKGTTVMTGWRREGGARALLA